MPEWRGDGYTVRLDNARLLELIRSAPAQADQMVEAAAREGERMVKQSFGTSPAGATYKRGGVVHVASRAGYSPNIDTGKLLNAITVYKPAELRRIIGTGDVEYAPYLEFGTVRMGARPFMRPMVVNLQRALPGLFARMIR